MKRKYKLLIIILISASLTYLIYFFNKTEKINLVAIGDGISSGETSFNIDGISYNDYLKEYFENKKLLKNYNNDYSYKNYKIKELINDLNSNDLDEYEKKYIKQIFHNANLITICIGEEELVKLSITKDLNLKYIKEFINDYDKLINIIKEISDSKIILIGFYENRYLDKTNVILLNSELSNIASKYDITFINISDLMLNKDYYVNKDSFYFNYKGHKEIASLIVNSL